MKKIILASALTLSTVFAFDIASTAATVGNSLGITAESIGIKLADIVKEKSAETDTEPKLGPSGVYSNLSPVAIYYLVDISAGYVNILV